MFTNSDDKKQNDIKGRQVMVTPWELRKAYIYPSKLQIVVPNERRTALQSNPLEQHQCKQLPSTSFSPLITPRPIPDIDRFQEVVRRRKEAAGRLVRCGWMKHTVAFFLGPEQMRMYEQRGLWNLQRNRRSTVFTYGPLPTYVLFVETQREEQKTKNIVNLALRDGDPSGDECLVVVPECDYAIKLLYGKDPEMVTEREETRTLLVFEDDPPYGSAGIHYEDLLRCRIISTRLLSTVEKMSLEKRTEDELSHLQIRLLEFSTREDRIMAEAQLPTVPVLFLNTVSDPDEVFEKCTVYINYGPRLCQSVGVAVNLVHDREKAWALKVFGEHRLRSKADEQFEQESEREIYLSNFPEYHSSFSDRKWLVKKICANNGIHFESITKIPFYDRQLSEEEFEVNDEKVRCSIGRVINKFAFDANVVDAFNGYGQPYDEEAALWYVEKRRGRIAYWVDFNTAQDGERIMDRWLNRSSALESFCYLGVEPEVTPVYRITCRISRRMRVSYERMIRDMDTTFREYFAKLSDAEHTEMMSNGAQYYSLKIVELWEDDDTDVGLIGVEGWSPEWVRENFNKFRKELAPVKFLPMHGAEMFYGVGEKYVWSLRDKYGDELLVDVDKFAEVISLFGSAASSAFRDLQDYTWKKKSIEMHTLIPAYRPFFNSSKLLDAREANNMADALGAALWLDEQSCSIDFTGTIEAYEMLKEALDEISTEVFMNQSRVREEKLTFECPLCFTNTIPGDFFRLNCGHTYCRECANQKVKMEIERSRFAIECDAVDCDGFWKPREMMDFILGGPNRMPELDGSKLKKVALRARKAVLQNNPSATQCHLTADCPGILFRSDSSEKKSCGSCHKEYCGECLLVPHDGSLCSDALADQSIEADILEFLANLDVRVDTQQCPSCNVIVMKDAGCNHMPCACGAHFCWLCRAVFMTEFECNQHLQKAHYQVMFMSDDSDSEYDYDYDPFN